MMDLKTSIGGVSLIRGISLYFFVFIFSIPSYALLPLVTEDTETQGRNVLELEVQYQYSRDNQTETFRDPEELLESEIAGQSVFGRHRAREYSNMAGINLIYGIVAPLDILISLNYRHVHTLERHLYYTGPLQGIRLRESGTVTGLSDITVEFKWKFFEYKALSMGVKPGFILPTGNEDRGLGAGKFGVQGYFIASLDLKPLIMHFNLGYIRNQNRINEREDIWHASLACELWLVKDHFRLVADAGFQRNRDKRSNVQDAYLLAGMIGTPTDYCEFSVAFKYGIGAKKWPSPGPDYTVIAGAAVWFGWTPPAVQGDKDKENKNDNKNGAR